MELSPHSGGATIITTNDYDDCIHGNVYDCCEGGRHGDNDGDDDGICREVRSLPTHDREGEREREREREREN